jgi:CBS domain-containing protein
MKVKDVMVPFTKALQPSDLATKARNLMKDKRYKVLPVVEKGKITGILTRKDVLTFTSSRSNVTVEGLAWRPVVTITKDMSILEAGKVLIKHDLKQIPVIDKNKIVGLLSLTEIISAIKKEGYKPKKRKISDIMSKNVVFADADEKISKLWPKLKEYTGVPVVKKRKVVGVITRRDLVKAGYVRISKESGRVRRSCKLERLMKTPAITVHPKMAVSEAIDLALSKRIGILPVVDKTLRGIVTRRDLVRAYL